MRLVSQPHCRCGESGSKPLRGAGDLIAKEHPGGARPSSQRLGSSRAPGSRRESFCGRVAAVVPYVRAKVATEPPKLRNQVRLLAGVPRGCASGRELASQAGFEGSTPYSSTGLCERSHAWLAVRQFGRDTRQLHPLGLCRRLQLCPASRATGSVTRRVH